MTLASLSLSLKIGFGWVGFRLTLGSFKSALVVLGFRLSVGTGSWVVMGFAHCGPLWVLGLMGMDFSLTLLHLSHSPPPPTLISTSLSPLLAFHSSPPFFHHLRLWVFYGFGFMGFVGFMVDFVCLDFGFYGYFWWWWWWCVCSGGGFGGGGCYAFCDSDLVFVLFFYLILWVWI